MIPRVIAQFIEQLLEAMTDDDERKDHEEHLSRHETKTMRENVDHHPACDGAGYEQLDDGDTQPNHAS
jgi:hypothetical protein